MDKLYCPICSEYFEYDGETVDFMQDTEHDFECPYCGNWFKATVLVGNEI